MDEKVGGGDLQVYSIVTGRDPSWQSIIYDLINSEQLDPWNIDIGKLCLGYFEKIKQLEENNFFISSKILLAASFLLRIKSEILLNRYIKEVDSILFGKKEEVKKILEKIELDEDEVPILIPKSPLPRFKKVTLEELMSALDQAINTESRRIHKEIEKKQVERLSYVDIPKIRRVNIKDRIRKIYAKILTTFNNEKFKNELKLPYTHFTGTDKEERIACFLPVLHLSDHNKLWLEQEGHFTEIWIYLYDRFKQAFPDHDKELKEMEEEIKEEIEEEIGEEIEEIEEEEKDVHKRRVREINEDFENPLGELLGE